MPLAVLAALFGVACSPEKIHGYKDTIDNVYFDYYDNPAKVNNLNYTFYDTPDAAEMEVEIPVRISGARSDVDRYFNVYAKSAESDLPLRTVYAGAPNDYELETSGLVPAGEGVGYVKLTLKNHDEAIGMDDYWFTVKLDLAVSDDFDIKFSGGVSQLNTATVTFSRMLVKPNWWNSEINQNWCDQLLTWSRTANELFRAVTGLTELRPRIPSEDYYSETMTAINLYTDMMKDPQGWISTRDGFSITPTASVNGFDTFIFTVEATGREYFFQNNTQMGGIIVWQNLDTGAWDILYN